MQNPWSFLKEQVAKELRVSNNEIEESKEFGDFAYPCFSLAKKLKRQPEEIAKDIESKTRIKFFDIKAVGPYVNFYVRWDEIAKDILDSVDENYGKNNIGKGKRVMVEFSQPNTNKPMHIGHARNTVLGDSLSNILKFSGFDVIRANYYGDIGLHMAKTVVAYEKWGRKKKVYGKKDHFVGELYTKFIKEAEKNPKLEEEAREVLKKWELGDKKVIETWKKLVKWVEEGFSETYKKLGVNFDVYFLESEFEGSGKDVVKKVLEKKIAFKGADGEIVANLEKYGIPNCIILRSDGTSLYSTKDLALGMCKFDKYKIDRSIYVVGQEQQTYLKQIFKILELLGYENAKNCYHLAYGLVMLPEGKMSSRMGRVVFLDDILDVLESKVLKIMEKKDKKIAAQVAVGALKYALLKSSPENNIMFNEEEITRFDGDTGPYLQYTHARARSILDKAMVKTIENYNPKSLQHEKEKVLLKLLAQYPEIIVKAATDYRPHYLANYLHSLAEIFNEFYQAVPVLKAKDEIKNARLKLVESVEIVLKNGLSLLSIPVPDRM